MKQVASVLGATGAAGVKGGSVMANADRNAVYLGGGGGKAMTSPVHLRHKTPSGKSSNKPEKNKLTITTSMTFQQESKGEQEEAGLGEEPMDSVQSGTLKKQKVHTQEWMY